MYIIYIEKHLKIYEARLYLGVDILPFLFIAACVMTATYYFTLSISNIYLLFVSKITIAAIMYLLTMWASGVNTFKESLQYLKKHIS